MAVSQRGRLERLEALRGFAAVYVVGGHFCNEVLRNPWWCLPFRFSAEAVMLFFLLSGFVIYYSCCKDGKPVAARDYFIKRSRRIYPLFLISLGVSYLLASAGARGWQAINGWQLIGNIFML